MTALAAHELVQRVLVRMLYDPGFCEAVYAEPARVLEPLGLDTATVAQIVAHDRRAFSVDPWRGHRAVSAALGEAAVTALALTRLGVSAHDHMAFIASAHFHRCVMERGLLVAAFFDALEERLDGLAARLKSAAGSSRREQAALLTARACLALERAVAEVRRTRPPGRGSPGGVAGRVVRGAVRVVEVADGASEAWGRARRALGPDPVAALVTGQGEAKAALAGLFGVALGPGTEWVLVERGRDQAEPVMSFTSSSLAGLLERAATPIEREALVAFAMGEGATLAEAEEIVDELVADGLLVVRDDQG